MSRYRGLPRRERFKCAECGRTNYGNYFLTPTLCKRCGAKRRRFVPNIPVKLTESLVVTTAVEKRLRKRAEVDVPRTKGLMIGETVSRFLPLPFWASAFFVAGWLFSEFSALYWLFVFGWCFILPFGIEFMVIEKMLDKPRKERMDRVDARMRELAEERKKRLEEQERFYSSPEWIAIRKQVIEEEGRVCAECGKTITDDNDITVDHKYPRSKYPDLALERENLRVLCRRCNSKKGDQEWLEI